MKLFFAATALLMSACATQASTPIAQSAALPVSDHVTIIAKSTLIPGKLEEVKAIAEELAAHTRDTEEGALSYRWFLNEDGSEFTVVETYASSEAVLFHVSNYAPFAERLAGTRSSQTIEVYGNVSPELQAIIDGAGFDLHSPMTGFSR